RSTAMAFSVVPIVLTCEGSFEVTRRFVASFENVRHVLKPPLVLIDQSMSPRLSGEYLALVASMSPLGVYVHPGENDMSPYDSVQEAANLALEVVLRESAADDYILFLEDDIVFSSYFPEKVTNTYLGPETGFLTLYLPGNGYGNHIVDPSCFFGT